MVHVTGQVRDTVNFGELGGKMSRSYEAQDRLGGTVIEGIILDSLGLSRFLPRDAMQARPMPSCGVCVCLYVRHVRTFSQNE